MTFKVIRGQDQGYVRLKVDDLESQIVVNVSSTLTNNTIWFVAALCFIVDGRTDGRTFLPGLLGRLSGDDLKWAVLRYRPKLMETYLLV